MATRVRCPHCGQFPSTTRAGALCRHRYPWPHPSQGQPCPGSGQTAGYIDSQLLINELTLREDEIREILEEPPLAD